MRDRMINDCYKHVFNRIDESLKSDDRQIILAIDGMCGSGKSSLAEIISETYECNVFHMDDFFLPPEMRTEDRLNQPGGNVYYERFKDEVLNPLRENRTIIYRPYLCGVWRFDESITVKPKRLNIVEGSYSMHPHLRDAYTLSVFLDVEQKEQIRRIAKRNDEAKLQQFINKWIPLENRYFDELSIRSLCDIIIDTTQNKR